MPDGDNTPKKQGQPAKPWQPGQSGNPAGRPKGSRNALSEAFIAELHADFMANGAAVVAQVRAEKPDQYLKVIASLLPKELHVTDATLADMADNELVEYYAAVRSLAAALNGKAAKGRDRAPGRDQEAGIKPH